MDRSYIKDRYAKIRLAHGISARKLSIELGQSSEYINQIESGKNMPSVEGLFNFCNYFNMTIGAFFEDRFNYPVEYAAIIEELNKMDSLTVNYVLGLLKIINK